MLPQDLFLFLNFNEGPRSLSAPENIQDCRDLVVVKRKLILVESLHWQSLESVQHRINVGAGSSQVLGPPVIQVLSIAIGLCSDWLAQAHWQ